MATENGVSNEHSNKPCHILLFDTHKAAQNKIRYNKNTKTVS